MTNSKNLVFLECALTNQMDTITENALKNILVVEDERIIAINICSTLKQYGYKARYVSEPKEAIETILSEPIDLILMDIMLNGEMDGIDITTTIKKQKDIPVIYLTAYSDESTLNRAKTTEPAGYLIKPFNSRDLYISVEMAIYKNQVQQHIKKVEARLAENQKWETIGLVASGISHEVNNPLTSILNLADLIGLEAKKLNLPTDCRACGEYYSGIGEDRKNCKKSSHVFTGYKLPMDFCKFRDTHGGYSFVSPPVLS